MGAPNYTVGERYLRVRATGNVYPIHPEQLKLLKTDSAEIVEWDGTEFQKVYGLEAEAPPAKPISTPARKPAPPVQTAPPVAPVQKVAPPVIQKVPAPVVDLTATPPTE